jgi:hypothetical protein
MFHSGKAGRSDLFQVLTIRRHVPGSWKTDHGTAGKSFTRGFISWSAFTITAESPAKRKIVQCNLAIVNYTINRLNRRVLNRVSVERFELLVNRMGQAIALVLVIAKWEPRKQQASDDPQDDQRDRQTASTNAACFMKCSCFVSLRRLRMDVLRSQYNAARSRISASGH